MAELRHRLSPPCCRNVFFRAQHNRSHRFSFPIAWLWAHRGSLRPKQASAGRRPPADAAEARRGGGAVEEDEDEDEDDERRPPPLPRSLLRD
jgi:hypothetical protein